MKKLEGNYYYWPISLRSQVDKYFKNFKSESINNFIVPIQSVFLPEDIVDFKYIPMYEQVFFLKKGYSKTIYSQYFPNSNCNKVGTINGKLLNAKGRSEGNIYLKKEFPNYTILKIFSTKKHLFALAKSVDDFFIIKLELSYYANFENIYFINKIADRELFKELTKIEISFFDISYMESYIFINNKINGKLYVSRFVVDNSNVIHFGCILIKIIKDFFIDTFSLQNKKNEIILCVFDSLKKVLIEFDFNNNISENQQAIEITKANFIKTIDEDGVEIISHYSISTQHLNNIPPLINETIHLLILQSKKRIIVFDLQSKKHNTLIGNGPFVIPYLSEDLNNYQLGDSNFLYTLDHNGILFGNPSESRLFLLMSPKCRELYNFHGESSVTNYPINWHQS